MLSRSRYLMLGFSDALSAALAILLALWTWSLTAGFDFTIATAWEHAEWFFFVPVWLVSLAPSRHPATAFDMRRMVQAVANTAMTLLAGYLLVYFVMGSERLPRLLAMYLVWNAVCWTVTGRLAVRWLLTRHQFVRDIALVGDDADRTVLATLMTVPAMADARIVHDVTNASDVVVSTSRRLAPPELELLFRRQEAGVRILTLADLYESLLERVPVARVGDDWVVMQLLTGARAHAVSPLGIRVVDLIGAVGLLVVGVLPMLAAALAVVIDSGWPAFFHQVRVGQDGRLFRIVKLRTMRQDAEKDGPQWSPEADPRVTRVGALLRRTHLDELPNAIAVIRGDMSLVGPRPERPEFVSLLEQQVPLYRARFSVKPGLTGWAQVRCPYSASIADAASKLEYDLYYVRHQSLALNVRILLLTIGRIVGMKGR
jgi:lipopolysaccharide/colanic/teichoic acid biosynthesis glycosyltransferase